MSQANNPVAALPERRTKTSSQTRVGWRILDWAEDAGISRGSVYNLLYAKKINSVKLGKARIITTSPTEFLASLPRV